MATRTDPAAARRVPLTRERVLRAAIDLADREGIDSLSMRRLGQELGVEAMSLYNHVAGKDDVLDGVVDLVVGEVDLAPINDEWRTAARDRILSARRVMLRHPWAAGVIVSRRQPSPRMLAYMDSMGGIMRAGGFSVDLMHHAFHALGSRVLGFTQELFDDSAELEATPEVQELMLRRMAQEYPNITAIMEQVMHDDTSVVGTGCDDQVEFEFALDLILDGLERLRLRAGGGTGPPE
ncbi:MAG TPA: TetR/AcrR family transcriptional regulator C-terminal domain-containing protein [Candidatus Limnocylindrales bacterium]|nr:TetR/AcrR family transcriptional regulator C-terminal domain-containing protein [Candidatus Limnocylindrales bacterium]